MNKSIGVRAVALIGIAVLEVLLLASAASAWRNDNVTNNVTSNDDEGWRIAVDGSGNVVVGGYFDSGSGDNAVVTKLQGTNGTELWSPRCTLPSGTAPSNVYGLAVDSSGDAAASGHTNGATKFLAFKCRGTDGLRLWYNNSLVSNNASQIAYPVAVDSLKNVIAGGFVKNSSTSTDFAVAKFFASTGSLFWTSLPRSYYDVHGSAIGSGGDSVPNSRAVVRDGQDNVIAGGYLTGTGTGRDFYVVKLNASTGGVTWSYSPSASGSCPYPPLTDWDEAEAVAVATDGSNDIIAAGYTTTSGVSNFTVVRLSSAVGSCGRPTEKWRKTPFVGLGGGTTFIGAEQATGVAVDASGNVVAVGHTLDSSLHYHSAAAKLNGTTGSTIWTWNANPNAGGLPQQYPASESTVIDSAGNVVFGGYQSDNLPDATPQDGVVVKLDGGSGTVMSGYPYFLNGSLSNSTDAVYDVAQLNSVNDLAVVGFEMNASRGKDFVALTLEACSASDKLNCGNGVLDPGEACDFTYAPQAAHCTTSCRVKCVGDCNGNGQVTVDELLKANQIAQGAQPVSNCLAADANNDCKVTVDELIQINNNAQNGCPPGT